MKRAWLLLIWLAIGGTAFAKPSAKVNTPDVLVGSLYRQVVARHPLGIPYGEDMKVFAPYISQTLLHRFNLATACAADWHGQNPDGDLKPPPIDMFEDGIFSGSSEQASPTSFNIGKTELETNGSARVHVKLTWQDAANKPMTWNVAAVVVRENGRPVVNDVLFLKDNDQDIYSRLSEVIGSGCEGPRWVGRDSE